MSHTLPGRRALASIILSVAEGEAARLRGPGGVPLRTVADDAAETVTLDEAGLGIDSLEQLGVRVAIEDMFGALPVTDAGADPGTAGAWADMILAMWREQTANPSLTVATSGTTGTPRPCEHRVADLMDEAGAFAAMLRDHRRVVAYVPARHIYGLVWTALLPERLGVPVIRPAAGRIADVQPGDLIVAVPPVWQALARRADRMPAEIAGVNAGAPIDDATADRLAANGIARLLDIYGTSETGGVGIRTLPAPDYQLLPRWRFADDRAQDVLLPASGGGTVVLPDRIERTGTARGFRLAGRRDGAVQVGGTNVLPDDVAAVLRTHDAVADAAVRLGDTGRLKAFLVPQAGAETDDLIERVAQFVAGRLRAHARPAAYRIGAALPLGAMGKTGNWE